MNQLCKVCGEPAAGYHFGAFTCEGCKSFFGRTYNNLSALGECKNNGQCVINKKNRTSCKSCRLKKCLMVGMSKSGSRYGRRSNWFKIHCLIQDQAEMNNRLAEQGVVSPFTENKDLVAQYKSGNHDSNGRPSSHTNRSSNGGSPSSSDGRANSVPSPYASLYEAAKANGFAPRYEGSSPSLSDRDHKVGVSRRHQEIPDSKEPMPMHLPHGMGSLGALGLGQASPVAGFPFHPGMPLSPVSPLSPLNPASRFFYHPSASLFRGLQSLPKMYSTDLVTNYAAYQSRFMPAALHALNPVLKAASQIKSESIASTASPNSELLAALPEQDIPIDLSVKSSSSDGLGLSPLPAGLELSKHAATDGDSGFSPSSNEENNNSSPLDLTSKRTPEPRSEDNDESDEDEAGSPLGNK